MGEDGVLEVVPIARFRAKDDDASCGTIVFESEYRGPDALRGIDTFSHIWLIWSENDAEGDELEVSAARLIGVEKTKGKGHVLNVSEASLPDRAAIYDIKPYLPFVDAVDA